MPMKVTGVGNTLAMLSYVGARVPDGARKKMHRIADNIIKDAQLFAPVDKHNLEKSIRKEVTYGGRGRLQIEITAGGFVDGVDVDVYLVRVHENYESMSPGAGTRVKRAMNPGVYIGEKFLTRAVDRHKEKAVDIIAQEVNDIIEELS